MCSLPGLGDKPIASQYLVFQTNIHEAIESENLLLYVLRSTGGICNCIVFIVRPHRIGMQLLSIAQPPKGGEEAFFKSVPLSFQSKRLDSFYSYSTSLVSEVVLVTL